MGATSSTDEISSSVTGEDLVDVEPTSPLPNERLQTTITGAEEEFPSPQMLRSRNASLLERIKDQPRRSTDGRLLPYPALKTRDQLLTGDDLARIDKLAANVPGEYLRRPMGELVSYFRSVTSSDLEYLRITYSWIISRSEDMQTPRMDTDPEIELEYTTNDDVKLTRNQLLGELLRYSGFQVEIISGVVKSDSRYGIRTPSNSPTTTRSQLLKTAGSLMYRKWLAVALDDSWYLIDAYPSKESYVELTDKISRLPDEQEPSPNGTETRFIPSKTTKTSGFIRRRRKEREDLKGYFMSNAEHFIYTHYPAESDWQLLARPVTIEEFKRLVDLTSSFFRLGLEPTPGGLQRLINYHDESDEADNSEEALNEDKQLVINIEQPSGAHYRYNYRLSKIAPSGQGGGDEASERHDTVVDDEEDTLDRFVMLENLIDGHVRCSIRFPASGRHLFEVYCCNRDDESPQLTPLYKLVCVYFVDVVVGETTRMTSRRQALPLNRFREWGPGWVLERSGLAVASPLGERSTIEVNDDEELSVAFAVLNDDEDDGDKYLVHVSSDRKSTNEMRRYVIQYDEIDANNQHRIVVKAKFPETGWYALSILARKKKTAAGNDTADGDDDAVLAVRFSPACCYLVKASSKTLDTSFYPTTTGSRFGPTELAGQLGVKAVSHRSGYFQAPPDDNLEMVFDAALSTPCSFVAELRRQSPDGNEDHKDLSDLVFIEEESRYSGGATVRVRFPETGLYTLKIFGRHRARLPIERYAPLFTYLIGVNQPTPQFQLFPYRHVNWANGCRLVRPSNLSGVLPADSIVPFAVVVPGALEVRLTRSETQLIILDRPVLDDDDEGTSLWWTDLWTGSEGELTLSAQFNDTPEGQLRKLLRFQVVNVKGGRKDVIIDETRFGKFKKLRTSVLEDAALKKWSSADLSKPEGERSLSSSSRQLLKQKELERTRRAEGDKKQAEELQQQEVLETRDVIKQTQLEQLVSQFRQDLKKAGDQRDLGKLRVVMDEIEQMNNLPSKLGDDYAKAKELLTSLERVDRCQTAVLSMDRGMLTELRGYSNPPEQVHLVLSAALLILGVHEQLSDTWQACQRACATPGPSGLLRRIKAFDMRHIHPEIAARALQILDGCSIEEVRDACLGVDILYEWVAAVCQETLKIHGSPNVQPATDNRRQKQLLIDSGTNY